MIFTETMFPQAQINAVTEKPTASNDDKTLKNLTSFGLADINFTPKHQLIYSTCKVNACCVTASLLVCGAKH